MIDAHAKESNQLNADVDINPFPDEDDEDVFGFGNNFDTASSADLIGTEDIAIFARLGLRCRKPSSKPGKLLVFEPSVPVQTNTFPTLNGHLCHRYSAVV